MHGYMEPTDILLISAGSFRALTYIARHIQRRPACDIRDTHAAGCHFIRVIPAGLLGNKTVNAGDQPDQFFPSVEEAIVLALDNPIAGARGGAQPTLVQYIDLSTAIVDNAMLLKAACRGGDTAPPHSEHASD